MFIDELYFTRSVSFFFRLFSVLSFNPAIHAKGNLNNKKRGNTNR